MACYFTSVDASQTLQLRYTASIDCRDDLGQFHGVFSENGDEESRSDAPISDEFYDEGRAATILEMTAFCPPQLVGICAGFQDLICEKYNDGRGRKCVHTAKDALFMTLPVLKHGGAWYFLARMLRQKTSAFERMIVRFKRMLSVPVYEQHVKYQTKRWSTKMLHEKNNLFKNYPMARYAANVTFQPSFRPSGSIEEGKNILVGSSCCKHIWWRSQ